MMNNFWNGFEKQAKKEKKPSNKEKAISFVKNQLLLPAGASLSSIAVALGGVASDKRLTDSDAMNLANDLKKSMKNTSTVSLNHSDIMGDMGSHYLPSNNHVNTGTKGSLIAHELGHAKLLEKAQKSKAVGRYMLADSLSRNLTGIAGLGAMGLSMSDNETAQKAAPILPLAVAAPHLFEEGRASIVGLHHLAKKRGLGAALRASPALAGAFSTYLAGAAGAAYGAKRYVDFKNKHKTEKKKK